MSFSSSSAVKSPVVRNQTSVHVMEWLKECQNADIATFDANFHGIQVSPLRL